MRGGESFCQLMLTRKGKTPAVCPAELQTYVCVKSNLMKFSLSLLLKEPVSLGVLPRTILCHLKNFSFFSFYLQLLCTVSDISLELELRGIEIVKHVKILIFMFYALVAFTEYLQERRHSPRGFTIWEKLENKWSDLKNGSKLAKQCGYEWDETVCSLWVLEEKERHWMGSPRG